jgi:beta-phosphoglucomutase
MQHAPVFRATLFDFNGVLVDDELVHLAAFQDALRPVGIELTDAEYWEKYLGFDDLGAFEAIFADRGRDATRAELLHLVQAKRPLYMRRAQAELKTFPGAADLVKRMSALGPVGIVSGALEDEIELGLEHLGVRDRVGLIISAEHTHASKPDPEGYRLGYDWVSERAFATPEAARPEQTLVFEDSPAGIEAALAVGLTVVALAHSYGEATLKSTGAALVLPRLSDASDEQLRALYESHVAR